MFWSTGLILALAISQVPAEHVKAAFVEDVRNDDASRNSNRIVAGWEAYPGQIPHQVSLRIVNSAGGVGGCGASIASRDWIITAAHCTAGQITLVVRAGAASLATPQYIFETQEWYNHPTYNDNLPGLVQPNDISVVKLQRPLTYTRLVQPIRLQTSAEAYRNYDNEVVIASGYGRTWTNGATSEVLNWVYLRAVSNRDCERLFGTALINANAICARFYNVTSQSTCQGDSGGPLVHVGSDGVPVLVGIASFVAGGDFGCHSGLPAGFIRPGPFLSWLQQVTGIDFENLDEEEPSTPQPEEPTTQTDAPPQTTQDPISWPSTWPTTEAPQATEIEPQTTELPAWITTIPTQTAWPVTLPTTEAPQATEIEPQTTELPAWITTIPPRTTWPWPSTWPITWPQTTETTARPTTARPPAPPTTTEPEPEEETEEDSSSEEEDPEVSELLKKLIVKVKVKVNINNTLKKKVKVKCVDKA